MEPSQPGISYRRIGTILAEMGIITQDELDRALVEQHETGHLLGEILVSGYGVSRVDLADALAAQWEEAQSLSSAVEPTAAGDGMAEGELHVLLQEAQAARAELTARTDELSRRVASLEALVVGVSDALDELRGRPAHGIHPGAELRTSRRVGGRTARA